MRSEVTCEPCNVLRLVSLMAEEHLIRRRQGEEAEVGGRVRERTGVESDLTVMESTAECGDRLTENKAQISKILLPAKINVLVDI